jgi:chromosomal replication initiator protein
MVSIDDIKEICAKTIGVTIKELESRKRTQDVSLARQCAVYFSRKQGYKVEELGKVFNRNHSNITHTCKKIEDLLECDREMAAKINLVGRNINGQN